LVCILNYFTDLTSRNDTETYKGKVVLVVNVASECGYTPQYAGLEKLDKDLQAEGLEILA